MVFLLLLSAFAAEAQWVIEDTGVFQPLASDEIHVNGHGVYILNFADARILHYDLAGNRLSAFGSKGKGPGEFTYPTHFFVDEGGIYVADALTSALSFFDHQGAFVDRVSLPSRQLELIRVKDGWLYGIWEVEDERKDTALYHADDRFTSIRQVMVIKHPGNSPGLRVEMDERGVKADYSPISTAPIMRVSQDGRTAFLAEGPGFTIHVIDAVEGKLRQTLTRPEKPVPFDSDWADERFEEIRERMPATERNISFSKLYPDRFPIVRDMRITPDQNLLVDRWVGRPDHRNHPISINQNGEDSAADLSWAEIERLVAIHEGYAYVTTYNDKREEAGLAKVKGTDLKAFIAANPINFDDDRSRSISIQD